MQDAVVRDNRIALPPPLTHPGVKPDAIVLRNTSGVIQENNVVVATAPCPPSLRRGETPGGPHALKAAAKTPTRRPSDSRESQSECEKCGLAAPVLPANDVSSRLP